MNSGSLVLSSSRRSVPMVSSQMYKNAKTSKPTWSTSASVKMSSYAASCASVSCRFLDCVADGRGMTARTRIGAAKDGGAADPNE